MKTPDNRVLLAFRDWDDRKKELDPLLKSGMTDERTLRQMQLDHLKKAHHRLKGDVRLGEEPFVRLLHNQVSRLEKQLYPNWVQRVFRQLKDRWLDGPAYLRQRQEQRAANMQGLQEQLKNTGFSYVAGKLDNHLGADLRKVSLPVDCQLDEHKRLKVDLHFEKNTQGDFHLGQISASLEENGRTLRAHTFQVTEWPAIRSSQIWSLLEGRALHQPFTDASGHEQKRWVQLGPAGMQYYAPDHSFDIRTVVNAMPALTRNKEELIRYLENGQQVPTHWKHSGQFQDIHVQADPANKTIRIFDKNLQPVSPEQLNQLAMNKSEKQTVQNPARQHQRRARQKQNI